jgi:hypothetical protein
MMPSGWTGRTEVVSFDDGTALLIRQHHRGLATGVGFRANVLTRAGLVITWVMTWFNPIHRS